MSDTSLLADISQLAGGATWNTMLGLAAAGTISMATLEVIKALTPLREVSEVLVRTLDRHQCRTGIR